MATAAKRNDFNGTPQGTSRTRRIRVSQDTRQAERQAERAAERALRDAASAPAVPAVLRVALVSLGDLPLGAIVPWGYDVNDSALFRVTRPAREMDGVQQTEPVARIADFRGWLWEVKRAWSAETLVGRVGDAFGDPIASWLRDARGYDRVRVRAGRTGHESAGTARAAHFVAYDRRGAPVGMGYLDYGLTMALDWLDGAGLDAAGAPRLLTAGDTLALLAEMSVAWPSPERQGAASSTLTAQRGVTPERAEQPRIVRRVGIANER